MNMDHRKDLYAAVAAEEIPYLCWASNSPWVVVFDSDPFIRESWMNYGNFYHAPYICISEESELIKALEYLAPETRLLIRQSVDLRGDPLGDRLKLAMAIRERGFLNVFLYIEKGQDHLFANLIDEGLVLGVVTVGDSIDSILPALFSMPSTWSAQSTPSASEHRNSENHLGQTVDFRQTYPESSAVGEHLPSGDSCDR